MTIQLKKGVTVMSFIKRHKFLSAIFAVCILLMIKNSSIPYLFEPPAIISFIFDKPQNDFFSGIAQIVDIFSSAYVTSLLFYYMVDFLPAVKQEEKAKEVISPKLVSLYLYISELLAMIEFSAKNEKIWETGKIENLDRLKFQDREVLCKRKSFKNSEENGTAPYSYNLLKDCDKYRTLILDICNQISSIPSFSYCDTKIINIISEIQLSEILRILPHPNDFLLKLNLDITHLEFGNEYQKLSSLKKTLGYYVNPRLDCKMIEITPEEIQNWKQTQADALKQNPEIAKIFVAQGLQNK